MRGYGRTAPLNSTMNTSEVRVMVEATGDVLSGGRTDGFRRIKDTGLPVVLPAGLSPEKTLVTDAE